MEEHKPRSRRKKVEFIRDMNREMTTRAVMRDAHLSRKEASEIVTNVERTFGSLNGKKK